MKIIVVFATGFRARFPVKLIRCFAFGSTPSTYCLLKFIAIIL